MIHLPPPLPIIPPTDGTSNYSNMELLKKLSTRLTETESELSIFWNLTPALNIICKGTIIKKLSPSWVDHLGYALEDMLGTDYRDYIHPEDLNMTSKAADMLYSDKRIASFVNRYRTKNGNYISLRWCAQKDETTDMICATATDVTQEVNEIKIIEQALEKAPIGVFLADSAGNCKYTNAKWLEVTGLSKEEAKGAGWINGICLDDREFLTTAWSIYQGNGNPHNNPLKLSSCYVNKHTGVETAVDILAYYFTEDTTIGYVEFLCPRNIEDAIITQTPSEY